MSVDLIGLQYPFIKKLRTRLPDFNYVMVASTHNHEGPDTIGRWGASVFRSRVDFAYLDRLAAKSIHRGPLAVPCLMIRTNPAPRLDPLTVPR